MITNYLNEQIRCENMITKWQGYVMRVPIAFPIVDKFECGLIRPSSHSIGTEIQSKPPSSNLNCELDSQFAK